LVIGFVFRNILESSIRIIALGTMITMFPRAQVKFYLFPFFIFLKTNIEERGKEVRKYNS